MITRVLEIDLSTLMNDEVIALFAYVFLYLTYYFSSDFSFLKRYRVRYQETKDHFEQSVYLRRLIGFVLLGVIPFLIVLLFFGGGISNYGLGLPQGNDIFLWFLLPTVVVTLGSLLQSSKKIDNEYYPEVREKTWTKKRTVNNILFWGLYLLGYEFAIRGFLFFASLYAFGLWPAIIINSVIYSLIHIFKGSKEAYGAFFLGVLFCLITYYTNSIWFAFLNHLILAVVNDIKAVKASPKSYFMLKKAKSE